MNPVFVALDTPDLDHALDLARAVRDHVGGVKLGLEFFCAQGSQGVRRLSDMGLPVFLDLKLHDIPNTVGKAVAALAPIQPAIVTVHAAGGEAMLEAAKGAAPPGTKIVAVTVLTSLDATDLAQAGVIGSPAEQVERLAELARDSGADGIVCAGPEIAPARARWPEAFLVAPGLRPAGADAGDQKRVMTPAQALAAGASVLVVGRPITAAADPAKAARDIASTLPRTHMEARV